MFPEGTFTAKPFVFRIEGHGFHLSPERVKAASEPLYSMISGSLKEAQDGEAQLEDVNYETFLRVCNWMYLGSYSERTSSTDETANSEQSGTYPISNLRMDRIDFERDSEDWFGLGGTSQNRGKSIQKLKPTRFTRFRNQLAQPSFAPPGVSYPEFNGESDVLMPHAEVYVFAEKYMIHDLKLLATWRLYGALSQLHSRDELGMGDCESICDLVRYVYANTTKENQSNDDLRAMVSLFIGVEMERLLPFANFETLLAETHDLFHRFLQEVRIRISDP